MAYMQVNQFRAFPRRHSMLAVAFVFMWLLTPVTASAQAGRTWVSGVGDDVNPCSRTAPCKTFAGAISKTAAGGEIDALDPGGYGILTINKALRVDGSMSGTASILATGASGITVSAGPNDTVVLRNLMINGGNAVGAYRGIRFISGKALIIENCDIYGFGQRGISIENTNNATVFINNTNVYAGLSNGIVVQPQSGITAQVTLNDVRIHDNVNFGLSVQGGGFISMTGGSISGHGLPGVYVDASAGSNSVALTGVLVANNAVGIRVVGGLANVRVSRSTITANATGLDGAITSFGNNVIAGNTTGNWGPPSTTAPLQ